MDSKTIDLTDPFDDLLKTTSLTLKTLNERIAVLSDENTDIWRNKGKDLTLTDLLNSCEDRHIYKKNQSIEVIELSDDEEGPPLIQQETDGNAENVNEIEVYEFSDFSEPNSCTSAPEDVLKYISSEENTSSNPSLQMNGETKKIAIDLTFTDHIYTLKQLDEITNAQTEKEKAKSPELQKNVVPDDHGEIVTGLSKDFDNKKSDDVTKNMEVDPLDEDIVESKHLECNNKEVDPLGEDIVESKHLDQSVSENNEEKVVDDEVKSNDIKCNKPEETYDKSNEESVENIDTTFETKELASLVVKENAITITPEQSASQSDKENSSLSAIDSRLDKNDSPIENNLINIGSPVLKANESIQEPPNENEDESKINASHQPDLDMKENSCENLNESSHEAHAKDARIRNSHNITSFTPHDIEAMKISDNSMIFDSELRDELGMDVSKESSSVSFDDDSEDGKSENRKSDDNEANGSEAILTDSPQDEANLLFNRNLQILGSTELTVTKEPSQENSLSKDSEAKGFKICKILNEISSSVERTDKLDVDLSKTNAVEKVFKQGLEFESNSNLNLSTDSIGREMRITKIQHSESKNDDASRDIPTDNQSIEGTRITEDKFTVENLEDIRQQLKLQLNNLRNRKRTNIIPTVKPPVIISDLPQKSCFPNKNSENEKEKEKVSSDTETSTSSVLPDNQPVESKNLDLQEDDEVPNVLHQIRSIIKKAKPVTSFSGLIVRNVSKINALSANQLKDGSSNASSQESNGTDKTVIDKDVLSRTSTETTSSPFISNSLDEFLTDSKLNVSYTIPKSGAEEGLKHEYSVDPVVSLQENIKKEDNTKKGIKYKPKTLAEKRRILEKNKLQEERRIKKRKMCKQNHNRSYVIYKNNKVFINSRQLGKCYATVESDKPHIEQDIPVTPKKPSLLTELYRKAANPLKYKPGPLSKKHRLQTDYSRWTTEMRTLPKVILNIMPELGKPVHRNLLPIVCQSDEEISDNRIEFALSALVDKTPHKPSIIPFEVPYENNQNSILVRKKRVLRDPEITNSKTIKCNIESNYSKEDVAMVMENLIKYVETKEVADSLIKDDEDLVKPSEKPSKAGPIRKRNWKQLSRTSRELLRLNCKVVNMESKENASEFECFQEFCTLGCVCKSLLCDTLIGLHCKKTSCIFGCSCPKETSKVTNISRPYSNIPTELLSINTVTRIEDEAKRNLAKEEKEFTQTVICASGKTIVVGVGNKPRRAARAPKKYTDFFDEDEEDVVNSNLEKEKKFVIRPCCVEVDKWNFSDIKPYCLVHRLYDCHCQGLSTFPPDFPVKGESKNLYRKKKIKLDISADSKHSTNLDTPLDGVSETGRPFRMKKNPYNLEYIHYNVPETSVHDLFPHCARTTELSNKYLLQNRHILKTACSMDYVNKIPEDDIARLKSRQEADLPDNDKLKKYLIEEKEEQRQVVRLEQQRSTHRRKQDFRVRNESLNVNQPPKPVIPTRDQASSVFRGEIIVNDTEWIKKISNNAKQPLNGYARILPWTALLKGFSAKLINVYCIWDVPSRMPLRLLLNVGPKIADEKVFDIELHGFRILEAPLKGRSAWIVHQSESVRDIIRWLLSGSLSSKYKASCLSFLLVETLPRQFEVRGLCTQTEHGRNAQKTAEAQITDENMSDEITEIKHKNMNNEIESLFITKGKYVLRELIEDGFDDDDTDNLYMWVGLPEVYKVAKWRVVFLKEFVYLYFKKIKYSIKYTDLVKLTEMAKEEQLTLLVRNLQIRRSNDHSLYGLYISPKYTDRIFIGPYFINFEEEDVDTLKLMNQSLISTESLNVMKGNSKYRCGHWMFERPYLHTPKNFIKEQPLPSTSTATVASSDKKPSVSAPALIMPSASIPNTDQIFSHKGFPVHIKNCKPRTPSEFNRYIITNIPHFGYLGAYQPEDSSKLEVSWPFEKKVLQFENADHARDFLQERFSQLLQPVPTTFKIQVIVLINLDLKEHQPVNSDFLSGHCICGYFGTYNFKELTDEFCREKLKMPRERITKLFAKRAHEYMYKKIAELANLAGVDKISGNLDDMELILEKSKEKIKFLEQLRIKQFTEMQTRENQLVGNIKKVFSIIRNMPAKERNIESKILKEIIQIRPKRLAANETIEIKDDEKAPGVSPPKKIQTIYPVQLFQGDEMQLNKRKLLNPPMPQKRKLVKLAPSTSLLTPSTSLLAPSTAVAPSASPLVTTTVASLGETDNKSCDKQLLKRKDI